MQQMSVMLDPMRTGLEAKSLEAKLRALVIGQDEAIDQIVNVYQTYLTGLISPGRPIGNFLFLGPTGSTVFAWWKTHNLPQRKRRLRHPDGCAGLCAQLLLSTSE